MIDTPVSASPAMIARSTGAAPRQRGSSDGWHVEDLVVREQRLLDQHAVGADDQRVGLGGGDPLEHVRLVQALGLDQLEAERLRPHRDGRRRQRAPAAGPAVRARDTSTGWCGPPARRSSTAAAKSEVPR